MVGDKWKLWGDEYPYKNICNLEKGKKGVSEKKQGVGVGLRLLRTHRLLKNVFEEIGAVHFRFLVLSD